MIRFTGYSCALGALALAGLAACGEDHFDPLPFGDGGPRTDANHGGADASTADAPILPPDATIDLAGPTITIIAPAAPAAGDYSAEAIVTQGSVTVLCSVSRNETSNTPVDSSSVVLSIVSGGDAVELAGTPASGADEYQATLDVSDFDNGALEVRCSAADLADDPHTNSATAITYLDLGPKIEIFSPIDSQSYGQQLDIAFAVTEAPVADDDGFGAVDVVTVKVGGVETVVEPTGGGSYFGTVLFDDPAFDPSLAGDVEIQIEAANVRPVSRLTKAAFVADTDGPVIAVSAPVAGSIIGGFLDIVATIDDTAGVATVVARIAHEHEIVLESNGGTTFSGTFDTRLLSDFFVFPLIEVVAIDGVGNETGVGRVVTLDNRPPLSSLDPPAMREGICNIEGGGQCTPANGDPMMCSNLFDPVGSDAANDGQTVGQLFELRARIEDQGNGPLTPPVGILIPYAGTDEDGVELFVLDDSSLPLMVDLDLDGTCDDINPELEPTSFPNASNEAAVASMVPLAPEGGAIFEEVLPDLGTGSSIDDTGCQDASTEVSAPDPLCNLTSPATQIIPDLDDGPAIFSLAPVTDQSCMGNAFDAPASNISDGWACIAVRARDAIGNVRVSPPFRVCIDFDGDGLDADGNGLDAIGCAPSIGEIAEEGSRPACTDGCEAAATFTAVPSRQIRMVDSP